jgi:hypothetical protein
MSLDSDPTSLTGDPPAVAQPTIPPPPDPEAQGDAAPAGSKPRFRLARPRVFGGALVALVGLSIGGYVLLAPHESDAAKTATTTTSAAVIAKRPGDLLARIDQTMANTPAELLDQPCSTQDERIPLVLYSNAETRSAKTPSSASDLALFSSAISMSDFESKLSSARRVGIVRTLNTVEPRASVGMPAPGRYEGQLVIVDTATGAAVCHTKILAWSSSIVEQSGIADRALRDDFSDRVHSAFSEGGNRLRVDLEL